MINIEFKLKKNKAVQRYQMFINGAVCKHVSTFKRLDGKMWVSVYDQETCDVLSSENLTSLAPHFSSLKLPCEIDWCQHFDSVEFDFAKNGLTVQIELRPDFEQWANPYSIAEYADAIERAIKFHKRKGLTFFQDSEVVSNGFGLRCRVLSRAATAGKEMERCLQLMKIICEEAEKTLLVSARRNSLATFFSFPPSIRTACEQYLLYFIQFLDDLGIKADAEIKEDAHRVLFSVTPTESKTALAQIREALDLYLSLPDASESSINAIASTDLASQQLVANIFHLKSQLMLANAALTAKDAAIEALQLSNFQYRQSMESAQEKKRDQESLLGEAVHVTKFEAKGIKVDLPLLLRKLKRRLGWGDKA